MTLSPTKLPNHEATQWLQDAYQDATKNNGLIDFTNRVRAPRGQYGLVKADLNTLFANRVWKEETLKSGHVRVRNYITGIQIEYVDRYGAIDPGAVKAILEKIQEHLNKMGNEIFAYKTQNWKNLPDYAASLNRWRMINPH